MIKIFGFLKNSVAFNVCSIKFIDFQNEIYSIEKVGASVRNNEELCVFIFGRVSYSYVVLCYNNNEI